MDPIGRDVLTKVKNAKGLEGAIIAGGFVRDHIMGGRFKDIDIFIPYDGNKVPNEFFDWFDVQKEFTDFKVMSNIISESKTQEDDYSGIPGLKEVFSVKYLETIPVQFIFHSDPDPDTLLSSFDFNICKCYFDGDDVHVSDEADKDLANNQATLANVRSIEHLPKHLDRFNRWKEKYPQLRFHSEMQLVSNNHLKEREKYYREYYREYYRKEYERKLQSVASTGNVGPGHTTGSSEWAEYPPGLQKYRKVSGTETYNKYIKLFGENP